ncbi:MAG TPA: carboxypeptidase-like regulatory domain-containing protein [Chthoniobacterales bacterium]|nr:carboxypeptidase-like regulatory domain-containing protein [Chthoniobacterales bacterium]
MKNMTRSVLLLLGIFAASAIYGGEPPGVAGVDVTVKQNPAKRGVTDARGNFALDALPPGPCTLAFHARKANDTKAATTNKVTVATSYSIKIEGTKHSVNQSGLTSEKLIAGVEIPVQLGPGAKVRGRVLAGETKKMVWIAQEPGSHIPGHWAPADSPEASHRNAQGMSQDDLRDMKDKSGGFHQEGWKQNTPIRP